MSKGMSVDDLARLAKAAAATRTIASTVAVFAVAGVGVYAFIKIKNAKKEIVQAHEFVKKKINPMDKENLAHQAAEKVVGKEKLATAGDNFFSAVDWFAERVGFQNGIDGVKGQPLWKQKEQTRRAGNHATRKTGANSNG